MKHIPHAMKSFFPSPILCGRTWSLMQMRRLPNHGNQAEKHIIYINVVNHFGAIVCRRDDSVIFDMIHELPTSDVKPVCAVS